VKNRLTDLNDYLFAQLERLADEDLSGEAIATEIQRAGAIVDVADTIVENARLQLAACKLVADHGDRFAKQLPMIAPAALEVRP
jgi:hypothetical protein